MAARTRPDRPFIHLTGVTIDCADAEELAQFYAKLLGWEVPAEHETRWIPHPIPAATSPCSFRRRNDTSRRSGRSSQASRPR